MSLPSNRPPPASRSAPLHASGSSSSPSRPRTLTPSQTPTSQTRKQILSTALSAITRLKTSKFGVIGLKGSLAIGQVVTLGVLLVLSRREVGDSRLTSSSELDEQSEGHGQMCAEQPLDKWMIASMVRLTVCWGVSLYTIARVEVIGRRRRRKRTGRAGGGSAEGNGSEERRVVRRGMGQRGSFGVDPGRGGRVISSTGRETADDEESRARETSNDPLLSPPLSTLPASCKPLAQTHHEIDVESQRECERERQRQRQRSHSNDPLLSPPLSLSPSLTLDSPSLGSTVTFSSDPTPGPSTLTQINSGEAGRTMVNTPPAGSVSGMKRSNGAGGSGGSSFEKYGSGAGANLNEGVREFGRKGGLVGLGVIGGFEEKDGSTKVRQLELDYTQVGMKRQRDVGSGRACLAEEQADVELGQDELSAEVEGVDVGPIGRVEKVFRVIDKIAPKITALLFLLSITLFIYGNYILFSTTSTCRISAPFLWWGVATVVGVGWFLLAEVGVVVVGVGIMGPGVLTLLRAMRVMEPLPAPVLPFPPPPPPMHIDLITRVPIVCYVSLVTQDNNSEEILSLDEKTSKPTQSRGPPSSFSALLMKRSESNDSNIYSSSSSLFSEEHHADRPENLVPSLLKVSGPPLTPGEPKKVKGNQAKQSGERPSNAGMTNPRPKPDLEDKRYAHPPVRLPANLASCTICLMDFVEARPVTGESDCIRATSVAQGDGDVLRLLQCGHVFHQECIDPWLGQVSGRCPVCAKAVEV